MTNVLVAGGGVAAVEAALALRALARLRVRLIAPESGDGSALRFALARLRELGAIATEGSLVRVDVGARAALTAAGELLAYDHLLVASGASRHAALPGALTLWVPGAGRRLDITLRVLERAHAPRVVLVLPAGAGWALPLYELALDCGRRLDATVTVVTPERRPLEVYGERAADAVAAVLERAGVAIRTETEALVAGHGAVTLAGGETLAAEAVFAAPALRGPDIGGLRVDADGFIEVDERCAAADGVFAAGDATAGPHKLACFAAHQAGVAAAAIAGAPEPPAPVLRGLLLTGGDPLYLRRDADGTSHASHRALWWPPVKFPGRHLASFLVSGGRSLEPLVDRSAVT